jgi:hypothetical protein
VKESTMTAHTLTHTMFHVWLDQPDHDEADSHGLLHREVLVRNGDQLRAELEASKLRLPHIKVAPLHATSLWLWAACARLGYTDSGAQDFMATELVSYRPVAEGDEPVDPTDQTPSYESP